MPNLFLIIFCFLVVAAIIHYFLFKFLTWQRWKAFKIVNSDSELYTESVRYPSGSIMSNNGLKIYDQIQNNPQRLFLYWFGATPCLIMKDSKDILKVLATSDVTQTFQGVGYEKEAQVTFLGSLSEQEHLNDKWRLPLPPSFIDNSLKKVFQDISNRLLLGSSLNLSSSSNNTKSFSSSMNEEPVDLFKEISKYFLHVFCRQVFKGYNPLKEEEDSLFHCLQVMFLGWDYRLERMFTFPMFAFNFLTGLQLQYILFSSHELSSYDSALHYIWNFIEKLTDEIYDSFKSHEKDVFMDHFSALLLQSQYLASCCALTIREYIFMEQERHGNFEEDGDEKGQIQQQQQNKKKEQEEDDEDITKIEEKAKRWKRWKKLLVKTWKKYGILPFIGKLTTKDLQWSLDIAEKGRQGQGTNNREIITIPKGTWILLSFPKTKESTGDAYKLQDNEVDVAEDNDDESFFKMMQNVPIPKGQQKYNFDLMIAVVDSVLMQKKSWKLSREKGKVDKVTCEPSFFIQKPSFVHLFPQNDK